MDLLFLGDWGRKGEPGQQAVAMGMARWAAQHPIAAVVTTGDNFYEEGVSAVDDPHWRESFNDVYTDDTLSVPWLAALGNHDYQGDPEAQIAFSLHDRRWHLPSMYYSLEWHLDERHSAQMVVIDTTPFVGEYRYGGEAEIAKVAAIDTAAQLDWLRETLEQSDSRWKIVVGHHPVYSGSPVHGSTSELQMSLRELFERTGVDAYVCGHEHDLQHLEENGVHYLVTGAGSDWRPTGMLSQTEFCCAALGFLTMSLSSSELVFRFHNSTGNVIHHASRRRVRATPPRAA